MNFRVCGAITLFVFIPIVAYSQGPNDIRNFVKPLKQVSAAGAGVMFSVTPNGEIYGWSGNEWKLIEGQLSQLSVGIKNTKPELWGVNALNNSIWRATEAGWSRQPGSAKYVAVSKDGDTVVAIDVNGKPFQWNGSGWTELPNPIVLKQVAIGKRDQIYGLTEAGQLVRWRASLNKWVPIKSRMLRSISVGADGSIGGVDSSNVGMVRKAEDVDAELGGSTAEPKYYPVQPTVDNLEIVDQSVQLAIDKAGLIGQLGAPWQQALLQLDAKLVVSTSIYEPEIKVVTGSSQPVIGNGCSYIRLSGTLKLMIPKLTSTPNPSAPGQAVTFTLSDLQHNDGKEVTFSNGSTVLGKATLTNHRASFSTGALPAGTHNIKASWGEGDTTFTQLVGINPAAPTAPTNPPSEPLAYSCVKGEFTSVNSIPQARPRTAVGLAEYFNSKGATDGTQWVATSGATAPSVAGSVAAGAASITNTLACAPRDFTNSSARSWVRFKLPAGREGQIIAIPAGAHNNYVFPACNRVWWDNLVYTCRAQSGWVRTAGQSAADGLCHGSPGNSPFVEVGSYN